MINKINTKIRLAELADLANRLSNAFEAETSLQNDAFLKKNFQRVKEQSTALLQSIHRDAVLSTLKEADARRDASIYNLKNLLVGYKSVSNEETKQSATALHQIFTKYGTKITRESYSTSTSLIDSLLKDFSTQEAQKHIAKLPHLSECIELIAREQDFFIGERQKYEKALFEKTSTPNATSFKRPLIELINTKIIYFLIAMQGEERYENLYNIVKQLVDSSAQLIMRRSKEVSATKASKKYKTSNSKSSITEKS